MDIKVTFITTKQTFPLRRTVLQPKGAGEKVSLERDNDPSTFHLGAIINGEIIGIGTFHKAENPNFRETSQYQLRKMATSPNYRGTGAGKKIVEFGINHLKKEGIELLWCYAREVALGFYENLDFTAHGEFFEVEGIGPHKLMFIPLK